MLEVTKDGKVYLNGVEKKQSNHTKGYKRVTYNKKTLFVHRLVAQKYIPNPNNLPEVNHINGIKDDNRIENLEWVTSKENMKHAKETGLWGQHLFDKRKLTASDIITIRAKYIPRKYTYHKLAEEYNLNYKTIYNIVNKLSYKEII